MALSPFILRSPSVNRLKISEADVIPCPNTLQQYLPMGEEVLKLWVHPHLMVPASQVQRHKIFTVWANMS